MDDKIIRPNKFKVITHQIKKALGWEEPSLRLDEVTLRKIIINSSLYREYSAFYPDSTHCQFTWYDDNSVKLTLVKKDKS